MFKLLSLVTIFLSKIFLFKSVLLWLHLWFLFRWYHHVPWHCWSYAEGNYSTSPQYNENQDHCSSWEEILRLDWWLYFGFLVHIPADVDLQTRIWWIWSFHCSPQVLLKIDHYKFLKLLFSSSFFPKKNHSCVKR